MRPYIRLYIRPYILLDGPHQVRGSVGQDRIDVLGLPVEAGWYFDFEFGSDVDFDFEFDLEIESGIEIEIGNQM